jgi:hypothetical protein
LTAQEIAELLAPAAQVQHAPWVKSISSYDARLMMAFGSARFG